MFEKLVGNEQVKKYLKETIDTSLISHSYMFIGKEGVGKKLFATEYAKSILCETKEDIAKFDAGSHPDFKIIDPEKESTPIFYRTNFAIRGIIVQIQKNSASRAIKIHIIHQLFFFLSCRYIFHTIFCY